MSLVRFPVTSEDREVVLVGGVITINGSTVTVSSGVGIASAARSSQGVFTVTFDETYALMGPVVMTLHLVSTAARFIHGAKVSANVLAFRITDDAGSGAVQDVAAADNEVHLILMARRSGVSP